MKFEDVCAIVKKELDAAQNKFPMWPVDPIHAASIVAEESGELQQAALQFTYECGSFRHMNHEALHTAAMAIRFFMNAELYLATKSMQHCDVQQGGGE